MATTATGQPTESTGDAARPEFACKFCKRRKVKCDRLLPRCSICVKTKQGCEYPVEAAKPGPKLGTTRRKRRRSQSWERQQTNSHSGLEGATAVDRDLSADRATNADAPVGLTSASSTGGPAPHFSDVAPDNYPLTPESASLDVHTLAYIMHPSHDTASVPPTEESPLPDLDQPGKSDDGAERLNRITQACAVLGIPLQSLQGYIKLYFDNMTALSLFHQPSFGNKLTNIPSVTQLVALLASILSFSARYRFDPSGNSARPEDGEPLDDSLGLSLPPQYFEALSQQYVDEALKEHSHDAPPLCVLQALVLLTFQELIKGARGSAWRRLGVCVRVAYELDLHHVDRGNTPEQTDPQIWTEIEERRRTWWFIWEMDVFASTIRRCPAAIDWRDNETRFPVCDEDWFARTFQPSCFLETKPLDRLRVLQQCGTQSPKAWFIVLNSFMLEGHMFSKFRSPRPGGGKYGPSRPAPRDSAKDNTESLAILANALRCFGMALPKRLRHRDQFLSFGDNDPATRVATRQLHSAMYSIHVTTQLTRMMINHQDAYRGAQQDLRLNENDHTDGSATAEGGSVSLHLGPTRQGMQQYIEAADELLHIVSRSSEHHVRYVNPFLASTLWYGAVVHLGWKVLAPPHTNLDFIESKFAVMHMILTEFANFWDLPSTLQENLSGVEGKLSLFTRQQARRSSHSSGRVRNQGGSGGTAVNPPNGTSSTTALTTDGSSSSASEVLAANTMINLANDQAQHAGRASSIPHRPSTVTNNSNPNPGPGPGPGQGPGPESTDWLPPNTTGSSYCRRDSQTVFTPRSITVRGANSNYPNTGGSTGGGGDDQFIFDDSWLMTTSGSGGGGSNNMAVLNETFPAQDNAAHPPRGLWDDLQLDLDFAMDPESLFQGIMNYN